MFGKTLDAFFRASSEDGHGTGAAPIPFAHAGLHGRLGEVTLPPRWLDMVSRLTVAFQPVVNIHSGRTLGVQALTRGLDGLGYANSRDFLDAAARDRVLTDVTQAIKHMSGAGFRAMADSHRYRLFLGLDGRLLAEGGPGVRLMEQLVERFGLEPAQVVVEITGRHADLNSNATLRQLEDLRGTGIQLALGDFGTGQAGLQALYLTETGFIRLDPFFIAEADADSRKKLLLNHMARLAHMLGNQVIADGVESEREFIVCREVGCDLIQGPLVSPPRGNAVEIRPAYEHVGALSRGDRRQLETDSRLIQEQVEYITPLSLGMDMEAIFGRFRRDKHATLLPVVDHAEAPLGVIREPDIKAYAYSLYGRDLMSNKAFRRPLHDFITRCPVVDIHTTAESILAMFSADEEQIGILMVEDNRYAGLMNATSLLRLIQEKNLQAARDQNPLTRLPGNNRIQQEMAGMLGDLARDWVVVYLDFDNFKPFNDTYGFRQGDRAILRFAELLGEMASTSGVFVGHVGGDDFFAAFRDQDSARARHHVSELVRRFESDVESFYGEADRARGCILARDRHGNERRFPLLSASAALLELPGGRPREPSLDALNDLIAVLKKEAKASPDKTAAASLVFFGDGA